MSPARLSHRFTALARSLCPSAELAAFFGLAVLALLAVPVGAQSTGDAAAAASIYAVCAGCHGDKGQGSLEAKAPKIAGQEPWYLERQLQNFRHGIRGGSDHDLQGQKMAIMTLMFKTDKDVQDAADYISAMPKVSTRATVKGDSRRGRELYQVCAACHGKAGEGVPILNSPALAGASDWDMVAQLTKFKAGIRGTHPDDLYGRQMVPMMAALPDEQAIRDVVAYINTLGKR